MSYTVTVSGHKMFPTAEEAQAFEAAVRDKAKAFVGGLEGVTAAMMQGEHTGNASLMPEPPPPPAEQTTTPGG